MRRTQIYLEDGQDAKIAKRAEAAGVTKSTIIRQAIDAFLAGQRDESSALRRFRATLRELSPTSLPSGRVYVERLRAGDLERQERVERRRS